jgi:CDP-6-deoxy-D-xylo-4-hexulose-3-dehydrase
VKIPLAVNSIREPDIQAAIQVLRSGELTMGKMVKTFEKQMQEYLRVKHFVMVNSGSSANLAIIEALMRPVSGNPKLIPGDLVLVPSIAWPTTVWPLIQLGLQPIFVDVEADSLSIDLQQAQVAISESRQRIAAIFPIHVLGRAIPNSDLKHFADKNNIIVVNDVCESLGSWESEIHAGTGGIASSYSFYFSHHITTMEGGGIATNDDQLADDLRSIRSHGWSRDRFDSKIWEKSESEINSKFLFISTGFNIRPMEIQAAIGISQIRDIDKFIDARRRIASSVSAVLHGTRIKLLGEEYLNGLKDSRSHSWMLLPLKIEKKGATLEELLLIKNEVLLMLREYGIESRPALTGNFLAQPALQRIIGNRQVPSEFPQATLITASTFLVGCHHDFSEEQIKYMVAKIAYIAKLV